MKQQLRENMLTRLTELDKKQKYLIEQNIHQQLFKQPFWQQAKVVGITHSTRFEWNTEVIIEEAWSKGKTVALPKCDHINKSMQFIEIRNFRELKPGYGDILEPIAIDNDCSMNNMIDLLIVPGLVFDGHGYRIGFGGGFYDRYLSESNHQAINVSLAANFQLIEKLPIDSHDLPVDFIITEDKCIQVKHK